MIQLDLFDWAKSRPTADVLDWTVPFAKRVMERLHEYDDNWPKPSFANTVIPLPQRNRGAA